MFMAIVYLTSFQEVTDVLVGRQFANDEIGGTPRSARAEAWTRDVTSRQSSRSEAEEHVLALAQIFDTDDSFAVGKA
jgi:hypothetical protein